MAPVRIRSTDTAVWARSPRCLGKSTPRLTSPTWWPARPTRCRALATLGGDSIWMTRSTAPMSMPSSRLLVATTAGSRPRLRSSSMIARCSLETEPWWALAMIVSAPLLCPDWAMTWAGGLPVRASSASARSPARSSARVVAISLSRAVSRSASRRELAKTMVERCCSTRSTTCSSTWGQMLVDRPGSPESSSYSSGIVMSSTGTTTRRSHSLVLGGATISTGCAPPRKRATSSRGRTVALRADALRRLVEQRVEALEAEGEVGAALGAGDGVDLVDDDRVDAAQRLARLAGEHQEQRLGRRDQDVGRRGAELAPVGRAGVAGPQPDGDLGDRGLRAAPRCCGCRSAGARRLRSTSTPRALSGEM